MGLLTKKATVGYITVDALVAILLAPAFNLAARARTLGNDTHRPLPALGLFEESRP